MSGSDEPADRDELQQQWIESLLICASVKEDHAPRIAAAMRQLGEPGEPSEPSEPSEHDGLRPPFVVLPLSDQADHALSPPVLGRKQRGNSQRWKSVVAAICAALMFFVLWPTEEAPAAVAVIERSLQVAAERLTRHYQLQVQSRTIFGSGRTIDNELYVQGHDRFVLRHPGLLPGRATWLGRRGDMFWVVPAVGPVLKGDSTVLSGWLREQGELDTPYLHVTTILDRMNSRGFQLRVLEDESVTLPDGSSELCQHIQARLASSDSSALPATIELWAARSTGMAVRLTARWNLAEGEFGRESVVLTYQGDEPSLSSEWFTPQAHQRAPRRE